MRNPWRQREHILRAIVTTYTGMSTEAVA